MAKGWSFEPIFSLSEDQLGTVLTNLGAHYTRMQGENVQSDHCFLHHNHSPSLGVSIHAPHPWNCFVAGCQKGTDLIGLVAAALRIDRSDAVSWIYELLPEVSSEKRGAIFKARSEKVEGRFVLSTAVLSAYPLSADNDIGYRAIAYMDLCSREQADEFGLHYDRRHHRIIFPVHHPDGQLAGLIGRSMLQNVPKKDRWYNYDEGHFKKGRCVMGSHLPLVPGAPVVVVEGPSDYIFLRSCGVPNVRATMGADFNAHQVEIILATGHDLVPLFDKDPAGQAATRKFRKIVDGRARMLSVTYPKDHLNPDGTADPRSVGREGVAKLVASFGRPSFVSRR